MARNQLDARWAALTFVVIGAFIVLLSLDVIPYDPNLVRRRSTIFQDPHHWQITSFGLAFLFLGLQVFMNGRKGVLPFLCALIMLPSFIAPLVWFFYFSGVVGLGMQIVASFPLLLGGAGAVMGLIRAAQGKPPVIFLTRE